MKSKKKLFELLSQKFEQKIDLKHKAIMNETFGKESYIFIHWVTLGLDRKLAEVWLTKNGFNVNDDYWPGSQTSEVRVSYFKGWHWDE